MLKERIPQSHACTRAYDISSFLADMKGFCHPLDRFCPTLHILHMTRRDLSSMSYLFFVFKVDLPPFFCRKIFINYDIYNDDSVIPFAQGKTLAGSHQNSFKEIFSYSSRFGEGLRNFFRVPNFIVASEYNFDIHIDISLLAPELQELTSTGQTQLLQQRLQTPIAEDELNL